MQLINATKNKSIAAVLTKADTAWSRMRGLLGTDQLPNENGLWIIPCNSVHTFFMRYPIDLIFVDADLRVLFLKNNLVPNRLLWPVWSARSVFELPAGKIATTFTELGDQLHVGH